MDPVAFRLPFVDLPIYWYGVIVVACILIGAYVATIEARRRGQNPDHAWNGLILVIIFGLIGAPLHRVMASTMGSIGSPGHYSTR